jgi:hypothetical protein
VKSLVDVHLSTKLVKAFGDDQHEPRAIPGRRSGQRQHERHVRLQAADWPYFEILLIRCVLVIYFIFFNVIILLCLRLVLYLSYAVFNPPLPPVPTKPLT